tara:strand:+ start:746 stop:1513 length:768 start_codon:yes stop_codon:yes gene_type:complete
MTGYSRYFIEISYNGEQYSGWQKQLNSNSIQETLEQVISNLLSQETSIIGAGRTDAGVHAIKMFAHFDAKISGEKFIQLKHLMNNYLPNDIVVKNLYDVIPEAHARFDAISRTYEYKISTQKDSFDFPFSFYVKENLNIDLMNEAAKMLLEFKDFKSFSKSNTDVKTFFCKIISAKWSLKKDKCIFIIKSDRFLRNMVRAIVGSLIEIGTAKREINDFKDLIESRDRKNAGFSVPAKGLFLTDIDYPKKIFKQKR